jgi:hypothetical protein
LSAVMLRAEEIVVEDGNKINNAFQWSTHVNNCEYLIGFRSWDSSVIITTVCGLGLMPRCPAVKNFSFLHSVQTDSETHPASYPMGTGSIGRGVKLTTHLHLMVRSRKVQHYLPPYVFMM